MRRVASSLAVVVAVAVTFGAAAVANAGEPLAGIIDIEIPVLVVDVGTDVRDDELEIDESLLVRSAAKRLETVMETSSIVTVLSREDLLNRGYRQIADVLADIPGFESYRSVMLWGRRMPMVRGAARTILVLWDGVPITSNHTNLNSMWVDLPIDVVRRLEIVSGPGGVLWGANAYLGIVNIVTLRGDDTEPRGEVRMSAGGGVGNQQAFGTSATVRESFLDGDLRMFAHVTVWSSKDAKLKMPYDMFFAPFPGSLDGTITLNESSGPLDTDRDVCIPIVFNADYDLGSSELSLDFLGNFYCNQREEVEPRGIRVDRFVDPDSGRVFPGGSSRRVYQSTVAQLRWTKPYGDGHRFLTRLYYFGLRKDYVTAILVPAGHLGPEAPVVTGKWDYRGSNDFLNNGVYRVGLNSETLMEFSRQSLIAGAEVIYESRKRWFVRDAGTELLTIQEDGELLGVRTRVNFAGYANHKVRLPKKITVEGGVRVQASAGDDDVAYDALVMPSGAMVWNPVGRIYLKLNYAEGFRPVTLSATAVPDTDLGATYFGIAAPLVPERSRAIEAEISAVILERTRAIRRVHLRFGYQYSQLSGLILGRTGDQRNAGTRLIHTLETRADVAFNRGHRLILSGHLFAADDSEIGPIRHVANYKLHLEVDVKFDEVFRGMVSAMVLGPREDLNRLPIRTDTAGIDFVMPVGSVVVDRTEPVGLVRAGIRAVDLWDDRFDVGLFVENALDAQPSVPDTDFEKRETPFPLQMPGRSFYLTVTGRL